MTESPLKVTKRTKEIVPRFHVPGCHAFVDGNCDKDCAAVWWDAHGTGYVSTLGLSATERDALLSAEPGGCSQDPDYVCTGWCSECEVNEPPEDADDPHA